MIQILCTLLDWILLAPYFMTATVVLTMLWLALTRLLARLDPRRPADYDDDDELDSTAFDLLSPLMKQVYLSQECWTDRCLCRQYGLPFHEIRGIRDNYGLHEATRCQPARELIR